MGTLWNSLIATSPSEFHQYEKADELRDEMRQLANRQSIGTSPVDYELAQSVSNLASGLAGMGYGLDRIADGVADLSFDIREGFAGLGALFDWRMATTIALLEQQQTTLNSIQDLLRYPRRTQANEDKESARDAWKVALKTTASGDPARARWLDQAMKFYQSAAEKNPFDYTIHLDMGILLLENYNQAEHAIPHFQEAVRTAQAAGHREYESKAHFFAGRAFGVLGQVEIAYAEMRRALDLMPDTPVIVYECARSCASTGRNSECVKHLEFLLRANAVGGKIILPDTVAWWSRINNEIIFYKAKDEIRNLFKQLTDQARLTTQDCLLKTGGSVRATEFAVNAASEYANPSHIQRSDNTNINDMVDDIATAFLVKDDYFSCCQLILELEKVRAYALEISRECNQSIRTKLHQVCEELDSAQNNLSILRRVRESMDTGEFQKQLKKFYREISIEAGAPTSGLIAWSFDLVGNCYNVVMGQDRKMKAEKDREIEKEESRVQKLHTVRERLQTIAKTVEQGGYS